MTHAGRAKTVLLVDDEPQIIDVLEHYLSDEGFDIAKAYDGQEAVGQFDAVNPDLIILDLKMPVMSGLDAFRNIRSRSDVPIIMLTSRSDEVDRVIGLELGADDYITKPFSPREVVARVKTVLRRSAAPAGSGAAGTDVPKGPAQATRSGPIRIGELEIDSDAHEVRVSGRMVTLTPTEFRILKSLAEHSGRILTRAQLLDKVKREELDIFDRTLDRHIANLRQKIEPEPGNPRYVLTVFGIGYKMAKEP